MSHRLVVLAARVVAVAALVAAVWWALSALPATMGKADAAAPTLTSLPACANAESGAGFTRCVWDAAHMGNGEGRSFRLNRHGVVKFLSHDKAHALAAGGAA